MKKYLIIVIIFVLLGCGYLFITEKQDKTPPLGAEYKVGSDVIGTRVGTTTTGVYLGGVAGVFSATTTYIVPITGGIDTATFTVKATKASSTPSGAIYFSFLGSNDVECDTSTTTTIFDVIIAKDINWYDIGTHMANLAGTKTLSQATTTYSWSGITAGQGKDIVLENLNYECIAVQASASSTELFMQMRTK